MKASIIAVAAIVLVSIGAYFAVSSMNDSKVKTTAAPAKAAQPAVAPTAVVEEIAVVEEVEIPASAAADNNTSELLAAANVPAQPAPVVRRAPVTRVQNIQAPAQPAAQVAKPAAVVAPITVTKKGEVTSYSKGTVISVDGETDTVVNYNGVKVSVPQGQQVSVREGSNGTVIVSGTDMNGVKINDQEINSFGSTVLVYSPDNQQIQATRGTAQITSNGKTITVGAQQQAVAQKTETAKQTASKTTAVETVEAPAFVSADIVTNVAEEQTAQDVEETEAACELSPSTPGCI